jgi:hypothetical protein
MAKPKKCDQIAGKNIWDYEADILTAAFPDQPPEWARTWVIMRWMHLSDLRPLAAAIRAGNIPDQDVLTLLASMIEEGRVTAVKPRKGRGSKRQPDTITRQIIAARFYESLVAKKIKSAREARRLAADLISRDVGTVRKAVTLLRSLQR